MGCARTASVCVQLPLLVHSSPGPCQLNRRRCSQRRSTATRCQSGKGFGKSQGQTEKKDRSNTSQVKRGKSKGKKFMRMGAPAQQLPPQQDPTNPLQPLVEPTEALQDLFRRKVESKQPGGEDPEDAFAKRLEALKIVAAEKAAAKAAEAKARSSASVLDEDIYENPPALSQTVFGSSKGDEDGGNPAQNQLAAAVGALVLVVIFLVANTGGDLRVAGVSSPTETPPGLSEEVVRDLKQQLSSFESTLATSPKDLQALEGSGVIYATLGNYKRAEQQLSELTSLQSDDPDAWRLLAETRLQLGENSKAVDAYRSALKARGTPDFDLLQGLTAAMIQNGKPQDAVSEVQQLLQRQQQDTEGTDGYGAVELQLLLGRVYSLWKGHSGDAIAIYDQLIREQPDDYRGFLAKGVLLKSQQRQGDAERMFLQARFLAPPDARVLVDKLASQ